MRRFAAFCLLLTIVAAPGLADIRVMTEMTSGGDNANEMLNMTIESFVDGEQGNFYIRKSSNAYMKEGMYFYTRDGGRSVVIVNPSEETYSEWDLVAIMQFAGTVLQSLGPLVKFEVVDPEVKLLSRSAGPSSHGLDTEVHQFESAYTIKMRIMGMKKEQIIRELTRIVTASLPTALSVWMRTDPPKTGTEFDKIVEASPWADLHGKVALEYRTDTTIISGKKKKEQRSWTESKTLSLDRNSGGPPGGYGFPDTYQPVQMMPTPEQMAGGEEGDKKKKGRFGGLFKDGGS